MSPSTIKHRSKPSHKSLAPSLIRDQIAPPELSIADPTEPGIIVLYMLSDSFQTMDIFSCTAFRYCHIRVYLFSTLSDSQGYKMTSSHSQQCSEHLFSACPYFHLLVSACCCSHWLLMNCFSSSTGYDRTRLEIISNKTPLNAW